MKINQEVWDKFSDTIFVVKTDCPAMPGYPDTIGTPDRVSMTEMDTIALAVAYFTKEPFVMDFGDRGTITFGVKETV